MNNDKNNILFTAINNGDLKTQVKTKEKFIDFIKTNNYLNYDLLGDLLSKKNVISKNGINYYIF